MGSGKNKKMRAAEGAGVTDQWRYLPRLSPIAAAIGTAATVGVVLWYYYHANPVQWGIFSAYFDARPFGVEFTPFDLLNLFRYIPDLAVALSIFAAAFGFGRQLLRFLPASDITPHELRLVCMLTGLSALIVCVMTVGVFGFLYPLPVTVVLAAGIAGNFFGPVSAHLAPKPTSPVSFPFEKLWIALAAFAGLVMTIAALSPETFYDSLVYHLGKPNFWVQSHTIKPDLSGVGTSFYPGFVNSIYAIALLLKGAIACKLVHMGFLLLTCGAIYAMGLRFANRAAGLLGALLYFTIPSTMVISYRSAMEMPLAFFETMAVFFTVRFIADGKHRWLVVAGIGLGLGMGTKYTSFYCAIALAVILFVDTLIEKKSWIALIKNSSLLIGVAVAVSLPWWLYNSYYAGSPLAPFLAKYLGHNNARNMTEDPATRIATVSYWKNILDVLLGPWTVTMGKHEEAFIGPAALALLPLGIFYKSRWKQARLVLVYAGIYWIIWGIIHGLYARYYLPPLASVICVCAVYAAQADVWRPLRTVLYLVFAGVIVGNTLFVMYLQKVSNNCLGVTLGYEDKAAYLDRSRMTYPASYYAMADWINNNLPQDAQIQMIAEQRSYYIQRRVAMSDSSDKLPLFTWAQQAKNGDELARLCKEHGITHIFLSAPEAMRLTTLDAIYLEPRDLQILSDFWNRYVLELHRTIGDHEIMQQGIFSIKKQRPEWWAQYAANPLNYVFLYRILSPDEAARPHAVPLNLFLSKEFYSPARWQKLEPAIQLERARIDRRP